MSKSPHAIDKNRLDHIIDQKLKTAGKLPADQLCVSKADLDEILLSLAQGVAHKAMQLTGKMANKKETMVKFYKRIGIKVK